MALCGSKNKANPDSGTSQSKSVTRTANISRPYIISVVLAVFMTASISCHATVIADINLAETMDDRFACGALRLLETFFKQDRLRFLRPPSVRFSSHLGKMRYFCTGTLISATVMHLLKEGGGNVVGYPIFPLRSLTLP